MGGSKAGGGGIWEGSPAKGYCSQMSASAHWEGWSSGDTGSQCHRFSLEPACTPKPPGSCSISRGLSPESACEARFDNV